MGGAQTKNVANASMNAISRITTTIINNSIDRSGQSTIIRLRATNGNIVISGNRITQQATINTNNLLNAMVSQQAQQQLAQELSQTAQSLISGLNLGNFSESENIINAYMSAVMEVTTNIRQLCQASIGQSVDIDVVTQNGNILFENNNIEQISNIFSQCVLQAVSNQQAVQSLQMTIQQTAVAKTEGLSLTGLILLALLFLLFLILPIVLPIFLGGSLLIKLLFPIILLVGVALIIVYFARGKTNISNTEFSTLFANNPPCHASGPTMSSHSTAQEASDACLSDGNCQGYDWVAAPPAGTQNTTFYRTVGNTDCNLLPGPDNPPPAPYVLRPDVFIGSQYPPPATQGKQQDMFIITTPTTFGNYYIRTGAGWPASNLSSGNIFTDLKITQKPGYSILTVQGGAPPFTSTLQAAGVTQAYVVQYGVTFTSAQVYDVSRPTGQDYQATSVGTINLSPSPNAPAANRSNWSGVKIHTRNNIFLYSGIGLVLVGLLGTILGFTVGKKSAPTRTIPANPVVTTVPTVSTVSTTA